MSLPEGSNIKITPSQGLSELKMADFAGLTGKITLDLTDSYRKNKGYMIKLDKNKLEATVHDHEDWFVPVESVKESEE